MLNTLRAKIWTNLLFLITALLGTLFITSVLLFGDGLADLGRGWAAKYARVLEKQASNALDKAEAGGTIKPVSELLDSPRWSTIQPYDKGYPTKRFLIETECSHLLAQGEFLGAEKCAARWTSLNERDIDAQAFHWEAIRHLAGREEEGLGRLAQLHDQFQGHLISGIFLAKALEESGLITEGREMRIKTAQAASSAISRWKIYWKTTREDFYSVNKSAFVNLSVAGASTVLQMNVPANTTYIRVDPPPNSRLEIFLAGLQRGQETLRITPDDLILNQMKRQQNQIFTIGKIDPFFIFPLKVEAPPSNKAQIELALHLEVVIDIGGTKLSVADILPKP